MAVTKPCSECFGITYVPYNSPHAIKLTVKIFKKSCSTLKRTGSVEIVIHEENDILAATFSDTLNNTEARIGNNILISEQAISLSRQDEESNFHQVCRELASGISLILDFSWTGWKQSKLLSKAAGIPYIRAGVTIHPFVQVIDNTLTTLHNATDAVLIFENDIQLEQSLYYLVEYSHLRVLALNGLNVTTMKTIANMLPMPSFFVIIANTFHINTIFSQAIEANLLKNDRWNLVFTDFNYEKFHTGLLSVSITKYVMKKTVCCPLAQLPETCACPESVKVTPAFISLLSKTIGEVFAGMIKNKSYIEPVKSDCLLADTKTPNILASRFNNAVLQVNRKPGIHFSSNSLEIYPQLEFLITVTSSRPSSLEGNPAGDTKLANWDTENGLQTAPGLVVNPVKRFFRIGMSKSIPWAYPSRDPLTGKVRLDSNGAEIWEGYCIDFTKRLAKDMNFEYELVINNKFGARAADGSWDGLIGDLSAGKTDIVTAPLTMTSDREEVVDFVAPYFQQSGFTIVIRKPVHKTSLFKFMTVLRLEVWLSILASLIITSIMIWFLDKYSPYSAQNNKELYPYPCRYFTLKESFWFALTSFTPQGGGEVPKALSGRTLVAAYWLFVVLMVGTFTANLAAFLTIERMQLPVQSLDQLAKQSRINYTVVENSDAQRYFQNMKNAEDTLYRMWKKMTVDSSGVQTQYRLWDYPINEEYGHILQAIERTGPVPNSSDGIKKVLESEQGEFALIHYSPEIRYLINHNCNLTEVGDIFAEQPLAIAVQQGSQLNEEISRRVLDLQKDRYFESLTAKYWNSSNKGTCHNTDDYEGITLESLGGVFIATLFGSALAMITLGAEIIYHRRKKSTKRVSKQFHENVHLAMFSKNECGTSVKQQSHIIKPSVTHISVFPHSQLY
ncbi:glutamate receptor 2-like [Lycorma delicatula]|uniref:glutamate receptor 2-like n=1 Tax=Lycorma delicatula TaxID=130591 RepID=UPI003F5155C6